MSQKLSAKPQFSVSRCAHPLTLLKTHPPEMDGETLTMKTEKSFSHCEFLFLADCAHR